jgi:hypothetical protein
MNPEVYSNYSTESRRLTVSLSLLRSIGEPLKSINLLAGTVGPSWATSDLRKFGAPAIQRDAERSSQVQRSCPLAHTLERPPYHLPRPARLTGLGIHIARFGFRIGRLTLLDTARRKLLWQHHHFPFFRQGVESWITDWFHAKQKSPSPLVELGDLVHVRRTWNSCVLASFAFAWFNHSEGGQIFQAYLVVFDFRVQRGYFEMQ